MKTLCPHQVRAPANPATDAAPVASRTDAPAAEHKKKHEVSTWGITVSVVFSLLFFIAFYKLLPLLAATGLKDHFPMFRGQIVDARGETRNAGGASVLLSLLGIRSGWSGKLFGRMARQDEEDPAVVRNREHVTLAVLRALE